MLIWISAKARAGLKFKRIMKRSFDIFFAALLLVSLLPIGLVLAVCTLVFVGAPVLFSQMRPGKDARLFRLYKFRTMSDERDASGNLLPDDKRLTRFGRFVRSVSLDELPSLYNVLVGDMSFVGPRPLLVEYLPLYTARQKRRHEVRPGITGWAQVNGRNAISWETKFDYDVWYIDNWSLFLDLRILFMTVFSVLRRDGISQSGHATMEKFTGSENNLK